MTICKSRLSHTISLPLSLLMAMSTLAACGQSEERETRIHGWVHVDSVARLAPDASSALLSDYTVHAGTVEADGSYTLIGAADVGMDGSYTMDVPAEEKRVVLYTIDASGDVVAGAILATTGTPEEEILAPPCDLEGWLEAEVFRDIVKYLGATNLIDTTDLRSRIDAGMASAVNAMAAGDVQLAIDSIARAIAIAQAAELATWVAAGYELTQDDLFQAEILAVTNLDQKLNRAFADAGALAAAYRDFASDLAAVAASLGIETETQNDAEANASLALRISLHTDMSDGSAEWLALLDQAYLCAAELEGLALTQDVTDILDLDDAPPSAEGDILDAVDGLTLQLENASTPDAAIVAFAEFSVRFVGDASASGSILDDYMQWDPASIVVVDTLVADTWNASQAFALGVTSDLEAAFASGADFSAVAQTVAWTVVEHRTDYEDGIADLLVAAPLALAPGEDLLISKLLAVLGGCFVATQ